MFSHGKHIAAPCATREPFVHLPKKILGNPVFMLVPWIFHFCCESRLCLRNRRFPLIFPDFPNKKVSTWCQNHIIEENQGKLWSLTIAFVFYYACVERLFSHYQISVPSSRRIEYRSTRQSGFSVSKASINRGSISARFALSSISTTLPKRIPSKAHKSASFR